MRLVQTCLRSWQPHTPDAPCLKRHLRRFHTGRIMASRKVSVEDGFYDASQDLDDIEKRVVSWDADKNNVRTLEIIDLFAGKGNFCAQCQDQNYSSMTIDVLEDPVNHDILSKIGFRYILDCLLSVVPLFENWTFKMGIQNIWWGHPKQGNRGFWRQGFLEIQKKEMLLCDCHITEVLGGWATCGPPCGLFVFISSAFHKRSCFLPYGAQALRKIRAANQIIVNLVVLLAVAHSRAVFILNPSYKMFFPCFSHAFCKCLVWSRLFWGSYSIIHRIWSFVPSQL